jgi:hypothetical protein
MNRLTRLTGAALIAAIALAACTPAPAASTAPSIPAPSASPVGHAISGTFAFYGGGWPDAYDCTGTGAFRDIAPTAQVTLTDESGAILAVTQLGTNVTKYPDCVYSFTFGPVPAAKFYSLEVAHRGKVTNSAAQLEATAWTLAAVLKKP